MPRGSQGGASRYPVALEGLLTAAVVCDRDGQILRTNRRAADVLGRSPDRLETLSIADLCADADQWPPEVNPKADGGGIVTQQRIDRADGPPVPAELGVTPITVEGETRYLTQVQPLRDPIHRRVDQCATVLDELEYAVYATDPDWTIEYANATFEDLFGYAPAEAVGEDVADLLASGAHDQAYYDDIRATIETGHRWDGEIVNEDVNGEHVRVYLSIFPVETDGEWTFVALAEPATEADAVQRLRTQRDTLQMLNRILRHDVRNDLQIIRAAADQLADGTYLEYIQTSVDSAINTTETARAAARATLERNVSLEPMALHDPIVSEAEAAANAFADATVTVDVPQDVMIRADEMLSSLFQNLLMNALEHNDAETPRVVVTTTLDAESITVRITDNGPGMPTTVRDTIVAGTPDPMMDDDIGLGLYLVRALVDRYDGTIAIREADPRGTIVALTFPRADGT